MYRYLRILLNHPSRGLVAGILAATLAAVPAVAAAQGQPASPQASPPGQSEQLMQEIMAKRSEIQQLNAELQEIQEATIEANPELMEQRDDFVSLVDSKMTEAGHDPDASRDKIEDLQGQLEGEGLSDTERQQVGQELRQEMDSMQQAQMQAMQGEDVREQRQLLNDDLVAAMEEQNPETEALISKLQTAQQEYQQLVSQVRQQQQQGAIEPPGL